MLKALVYLFAAIAVLTLWLHGATATLALLNGWAHSLAQWAGMAAKHIPPPHTDAPGTAR